MVNVRNHLLFFNFYNYLEHNETVESNEGVVLPAGLCRSADLMQG